MKIHTRLILFLGLLPAALFLPQAAAAQRGSVQSVRCESNRGKRNSRGTYSRDPIIFQRQLNNSRSGPRFLGGISAHAQHERFAFVAAHFYPE